MLTARRLAIPAALLAVALVELAGRPQSPVLDGLAGSALLVLGLAAPVRSPRATALIWAGAVWLAGTLAGPLVLLHRGALAQVLLVPARGRTSRTDRAAIAAAYAYAAVPRIARAPWPTIAFTVFLLLLVARGGPRARQQLPVIVATVSFAAALLVSAVPRAADGAPPRGTLALYDLAVTLLAVLAYVAERWSRRPTTPAGVVVELGRLGTGHLQDHLARALGDPDLVVAFWAAGQRRFVTERGEPVDPPPASSRRVTHVGAGREPLAVLMHGPGALDDPALAAAVGSATRLAVANARLADDVRARAAEVANSRARLVVAVDEQRKNLERQLREGAERRLADVAALVEAIDPGLDASLRAAREELRQLARGIHPATLTRDGLVAALRELAAASAVSVDVELTALPPLAHDVETAAYYVCAEALANVGKYAGANTARVRLSVRGDRLLVEVSDDGNGGADPAHGSGLRGLGDRVEAAGGRLTVLSPPGHGTRVEARFPLPVSAAAPTGEAGSGSRGSSATASR